MQPYHDITQREYQTLLAIGRYKDTHGRNPSFADLMQDMDCCRATIYKYVHRLEDKGLLTVGYTANGNMKARSIQFVNVVSEGE